MRFLVVVPTIRQSRPEFEGVMDRIRSSFTLPTELHILDGAKGKPVALNYALENLLSSSEAELYVTLDDDIIPPVGWQEVVAQAFIDLPKLGMAGLWVGDDPELQQIVGISRIGPSKAKGKTQYRPLLPAHHVNGGIQVYRREVALRVGPQPITDEPYQVWEDAWRGRKVIALGFHLAFVEGAEPEYFTYQDPADYVKWKEDQVRLSRKDAEEMLRTTGVRDPWSIRFRRWLAKVRGRAVE